MGGADIVEFTYDNLDRLTLAEYSVDDTNEAFTIDDLGNRDSVNVRDGNNVDYDIDNLTNRYDSVGGNTLAYDAAGNLTTDKDGYQYEYDYENRITKIIKSGPTTVAEFAYDALGRRIKKRDSIADTNNIYYYNDNWQILCDYNDAGTAQYWFAYGNYIDEVLIRGVTTGASSLMYYGHDHLYSPVLLAYYTGTPYERYEYDAYGNCQIMDASYNPRVSSSYGNLYYFTGSQVDELDGGNLKIQYNRNRYYDYYTGRWLTQDPFATGSAEGPPNPLALLAEYFDTMNLYRYVRNNPLNASDPLGLWNEDVHQAATAWWAREVGLCFVDEIGAWNISKDSGLMNPPRAYIISTVADIVAAVYGLNTTPLTNLYLKKIAYWHFPGADLGRPVAPGSLEAQREVKRWGYPACNLEEFSRGLHQLQDSYSHQSNGQMIPWFGRGLVGHSRDRFGWNTERWDDPVATGLPGRLIDILNSGWFPGGRTLLKQYRKVRTVLRSDTDQPFPSLSSDIETSYRETEVDTKYWMGEFRRQCPCILDGAHAGESSCCTYPTRSRK